LLGHLVMGGITGFGVGMARMRRPRWGRWLAGTAGASMALHFAWDLISLRASTAPGLANTLAAAAVVVAGTLLFGALVVVGSSASRDVFSPSGGRRTLWGWPFTLLRAARGRKPPHGDGDSRLD